MQLSGSGEFLQMFLFACFNLNNINPNNEVKPKFFLCCHILKECTGYVDVIICHHLLSFINDK